MSTSQPHPTESNLLACCRFEKITKGIEVIKWKISKEKHGRSTLNNYYIDIKANKGIQLALEAFWIKIGEVFVKEETGKWNSVIISIRPDSGDIIAFPGVGNRFLIDRRVTVWVHAEDFEQSYYDLPNAEEEPKAFKLGHAKIIKNAIGWVEKASELPNSREAIIRLRVSRKVDFFAMDYDDVETWRLLDI